MREGLTFLLANGRWLTGGLLLTFFSSFGQTFFIALSNADIRREFALTHGQFGGVYMAATLASALTLPLLGRSVDHYRVPILSVGTMLVLAGACVLMGFSSSILTLVIALYLLRLFGQGMMTQIGITSTARWFSANRGRAISLVTIGHQFGEAAWPLTFVWIASVVGWRMGWLVAAAVLLIIALPAITGLVSKDRVPQSADHAALSKEGRQWTLAEVLRDPWFYGITAGVVAPPFIGTTIFFHQAYMSELRGWPLSLFATGFILMSALNIVSTLIAGGLIDKYGSLKLLPWALMPLTLATFTAATITEAWAVFAFMGLLGVSNGLGATLAGAMWPEIYGTMNLGSIRSVIVAAMVFGTAAGPGFTGFLIDAGVSYDHQLLAMCGWTVAGIAMLTIASNRLRRRIQRFRQESGTQIFCAWK
ncbi:MULTISPECIES: MFS transporter [Hyphomicrobiales]|uniref:MFS transporter n=1 Tax=Pannonibacter phragmitetus TaxID=121719 RepID=A0A0U3NF85_9HYPH|nr:MULTISPECIES: MFS transporter [Hyphomicrobiales]ALV28336.1 MFS transporter [Pannonibacter phragmitetus]KAB2751927.1 MFS transporter [Brucella anthropi]